MPYLLENSHPHALTRMQALDEMLNPDTIRILKDAGLTAGARCWDIGGGTGKLAEEMSAITGPTGQVTVTDIDVRHMARVPTHIRVVEHDVVAHPPPGGPFNFVNVRLVFGHVKDRPKALENAVGALRIGGAILLQDWGGVDPSVLLDSEDPHGHELYARFQAAIDEAFAASGNDRRWCTKTLAALRDLGLIDVECETYARNWPGGSAGAQHFIAVADEMRPHLVATGHINDEEIERVKAILAHPHTEIMAPRTWATVGYRGHS